MYCYCIPNTQNLNQIIPVTSLEQSLVSGEGIKCGGDCLCAALSVHISIEQADSTEIRGDGSEKESVGYGFNPWVF